MVRTDITLAQQVVQVGHACVEAGRRFTWQEEPCNLVVLGIPTQTDLQSTIENIQASGIQVALFQEPDHDLGLTAACTEPLIGPVRRYFRRFYLWNEAVEDASTRGPPTRTNFFDYCDTRI